MRVTACHPVGESIGSVRGRELLTISVLGGLKSREGGAGRVLKRYLEQ